MNYFTILADHKALGTFFASFREANDVARRLKKQLPQMSVELRQAQEADASTLVDIDGEQLVRELLLHHLDRAVEEEPTGEQPAGGEEHAHVADVALDGVDDVRELDLHRYRRGLARGRGGRLQNCGVYLADGGCGEGHSVEGLEVVHPR